MSELRRRNNRHNITWLYAKICWDSLVANKEIPPVPHFTIWESNPKTGVERIVGTEPIKPQKIIRGDVVLFGE